MRSCIKAILCFGVLASFYYTIDASCSSVCTSNTSCINCVDATCSTTLNCGNVTCKPRLVPFSQGENRARDYTNVVPYQFMPDQDDFNWYMSFALEYQQNFRRDELGAYFFPNGTNTITVGPNATSGVDVRNVDIGLSDTFQGTFTIKPRIQNIIAEPTLYLGLDTWLPNLWFWCKVPIVNSRWNLDCCETDSSQGGQFFAPDEMSNSPLATACPAFGTPNQIEQALSGGLVWGDKVCPLKSSLFICCESNKTAVADLPLHLGYNFLNTEKGYLGLYIRTVFPTGREKLRQSVFDPRIGYNRWQLGAGINTGVMVFEHNEDTSVQLLMDVYITHIFKKKECRIFDLIFNGCFSRYLLMKEADINGNYTGRLANFADIFTACVESKFNWNVDGLIFFEMQHKGLVADFGYEIKARAREDFDECNCKPTLCDICNEDACDNDCCTIASTAIGTNQYGIKGILNVNPVGSPVTTASTSTIAIAGSQDPMALLLNSSNFAKQLDLCAGAVPRAISHKVWGNIGYTWSDLDYPVFLGFAAEGEFSNDNKTVSLWGVWTKFGIAYY